ncbi:MAG: hypothetical protein ACI845_003449, partial [Gammaproteobacteria bacterium]
VLAYDLCRTYLDPIQQRVEYPRTGQAVQVLKMPSAGFIIIDLQNEPQDSVSTMFFVFMPSRS